MNGSVEGPPDQAWEPYHDSDGWDVRRRGWSERVGPLHAPCEWLYPVDHEETAIKLTHELNELDRLRRIEALALAWHNAILATNGVYDAELALRAALQPQEPQ